MDPLTHAISGAALARAIPKYHLPRGQFILLVLLTMAPDADIILRLFSDTLYLQHHRGLTHSLLLIPLWGWLIYNLTTRHLKKNKMMPWLIGAALLLHIMLDLITTFGTMIMAPFSDWRASLDLLFIIDPFFTACMLIPLLLGFIWQKKKRMMGALSLIFMFSYLGMAYKNQQMAIQLAKKANPDAQAYNALPMAFSPFHWQMIVIYPDYYLRASVNLQPEFSGTTNLFDKSFVNNMISTGMGKSDDLNWQKFAAMHTVKGVNSLPGSAFYAWFASYPVLLESNENEIVFGDLAFGAGAPGVRSAFELQIELQADELQHSNLKGAAIESGALVADTSIASPSARAWLVWRNDHKSELTYSSTPFSWLR